MPGVKAQPISRAKDGHDAPEPLRGAVPAPGTTARTPGGRRCSADDCPRPHYARGLCQMHLRRKERTGTTDPPAPRTRPWKRLSDDELTRLRAAVGVRPNGPTKGDQRRFREQEAAP